MRSNEILSIERKEEKEKEICGNSGELLVVSLTVHAHTMVHCRIEIAVRKFFGERSMHLVARTRELNGTLADP